eukprot:806316-Rhodomonas_salina.4
MAEHHDAAQDSSRKDFPTFNGNRRNYKSWKTRMALVIADELKFSFIHGGAIFIKDILLEEYETCTQTKHKTFSSAIEDYSVIKWIQPVLAASISCKMVSQSELWMVDHMGSSWTDWQKMGYVDTDAHAEAVFKE